MYYDYHGGFLDKTDEKKKRKKAGVTVLTSNKVDFKVRYTARKKGGDFIMMKGTICLGNVRNLK